MRDFEALAQAMGELDEDTVVKELEGVMEDGGKEAQQAMEACQKGMDIVGKLFEEGEYFVGDLVYAGELMYQAVFAHVFTGAYLIPSMLVSRGINFYFLLVMSLVVVLAVRVVEKRKTKYTEAKLI